MIRLPVPGEDDNTWGEILNEFLEVSHYGDGTLKPSSLPLDTDTNLAANSDSKIATQKAVKSYVDSHSASGMQPLDAELTAIAGLTSAADKLPYFTGSGTAATTTLSSFGRTLIDDTSSTAARNTLSIVDVANTKTTGALSANATTFSVTSGDGAKFAAAGLGVGSSLQGRYLNFTGSSYVNLGNNTSLMIGATGQPTSIHVRFRLSSSYDSTQTRYLLIGVSRYYISIGTDLKVQGAVWGIGNPKSQSALALNTWYDVSISYDGSGTVRLQLNTVFQNQTAGGTASGSGTNAIYLGKRNGLSNSEFMGDIAKVRIWNTYLSDAELAKSHVDYNYNTANLVADYSFLQDRGSTLLDSTTVNNGVITSATWGTFSYTRYSLNIWDSVTYQHPALDPQRDLVQVYSRASDNFVSSPVTYAHASGATVSVDIPSQVDQAVKLVPISQGGTGAVSGIGGRTNLGAQAKTSITVGYTNADYVVDSATTIDAALSAALDEAQTSGLPVEIFAGTYNWAAPVAKDYSNVRIIGQGIGRTVFQRSTTTLNNSNTMLYVGNSPGPSVRSNVYIEGITFDNNSTGSGFILGISWCKDVEVVSCSFINPTAATKSMLLVGKFSNGSDSFEASNIKITNCIFDWNGVNQSWEGITIDYARDVIFQGCTFRNKLGAATVLSYQSELVKFIGCTFNEAWLSVSGRAPTAVDGCTFLNGQVFVWGADHVDITGSHFYGFGDTTNKSVGIRLQGNYFVSGGSENPYYMGTSPYTLPYFWENKNVNIVGCVFANCDANAIAGGVINDGGTDIISARNVNIVGCTIENSGRESISLVSRNIRIADCDITSSNYRTGGSSAAHMVLAGEYIRVDNVTTRNTNAQVTDDIRINRNSYTAFFTSTIVSLGANYFTATNDLRFYVSSGTYQSAPTAGVALYRSPQLQTNLAAASSTETGYSLTPTIAQSGTAGYTAHLINVVETSTGSGAKSLIDAQVGSSSKFLVDNAGNTKLQTAGAGLYVKEGANATMGVVTLATGAATVSTTKVTANSRIMLSIQSLGTVTLPKAIGVTARSAGTSFTITSADATDTSIVMWQIIEPA